MEGACQGLLYYVSVLSGRRTPTVERYFTLIEMTEELFAN